MPNNEQLNQKVNKLVSASNPDEVKAIYQEWSHHYNDDLNSFGYVAPKIGLELILPLLPDPRARIHDAGCGTGLVGELLHAAGYSEIHGTDFSQGMLDQAASTGCYQHLSSADFGTQLSFADNYFDAVISIGVYTKRFETYFLSEMIRTLVPGGHFVFSCRECYFAEVLNTTSNMLIERRIKNVNIQHDHYMTGQGASAYYLILEKSRQE